MKYAAYLLTLLWVPALCPAQAPPATRPGDAIVGEWTTENRDARVNIFRATNGKYYGQIVWLDEPNEADGRPKLDTENPDPAQRTKPILGLQILRGFEFDADDTEWTGGRVYDPESGNDYSGYLALEGPNRLKLRGYVGISWLGRTSYWTR